MLSAVAPSADHPEDWQTLLVREVRVSYELEPFEWSAIPVGIFIANVEPRSTRYQRNRLNIKVGSTVAD